MDLGFFIRQDYDYDVRRTDANEILSCVGQEPGWPASESR